ncbi:group II intron reverse transcriptase domain-containing protein, partial [Candidatus Fermentibacteria bacterium]|nr:group II intron reverse transcriptase domain-containing protein [Candidatus Fermentibacteria bacterium]
MRRCNGLFERVIDFGSLKAAFRRAFQGSGRSYEACRFNFRLEKELLQLGAELASGTYYPAPHRYFAVRDPKEREIAVAPFRDRVVHHAVVAAMEPVFEPSFIYDSYACRVGKGTHAAVRRAQRFLRCAGWFLKGDVEKFFESVDHEILLELVARKIKDSPFLDLVERIVRNTRTQGRGLPIGNLTPSSPLIERKWAILRGVGRGKPCPILGGSS